MSFPFGSPEPSESKDDIYATQWVVNKFDDGDFDEVLLPEVYEGLGKSIEALQKITQADLGCFIIQFFLEDGDKFRQLPLDAALWIGVQCVYVIDEDGDFFTGTEEIFHMSDDRRDLLDMPGYAEMPHFVVTWNEIDWDKYHV